MNRDNEFAISVIAMMKDGAPPGFSAVLKKVLEVGMSPNGTFDYLQNGREILVPIKDQDGGLGVAPSDLGKNLIERR